MIMIFCYLMMALTDLVTDASTKVVVGQWMIYLIMLVVFVNLVNMGHKIFKMVFLKFKKRQMLKLNSKLRERIMAKYSIKEQDNIINSIRTDTPIEEVQANRARKLKNFKVLHIPMYKLELETINEV